MKVTLLAHTKIACDFEAEMIAAGFDYPATHGQVIALSAIRTCYSHLEPSKIALEEGKKYFGTKAKEGEGTDADRLIRHIINSGHTSTMEHINFTFAVEGVSRSLLAQLTRHRHFSYSVQSQRYVKFGSDDKAEGFDYVFPTTVLDSEKHVEGLNGVPIYADSVYEEIMERIQQAYDLLRDCGIPAEDARYILPNASTCNLVLTGNLRSFLEFYSKRNPNTHAQWEIQQFAEMIKDAIIDVEPWTKSFFLGGE
jgi:thymidylate synthase (FAD)